MTQHKGGPTPERFFDTVNAYQKSAAMSAAIKVGLFTAIAEGHATPAQIASQCKIAPRSARILADYMAILGFLKKEGQGYSLAEDAALFLDRNSPAYLGNAVDFIASPHLKSHFEALAERVRNGGAPLTGDNSLAPNHDMWVRFARGMAGLMMMPAQMLAKYILENLQPEAGQSLKILDIAAGHGMFGLAFLQQNNHTLVTGLDWPVVLTVAQENAAKLNVADRYATLPGDAFSVPLGTGYDVVLIPNFLHHFDRPTNVMLLKKIHTALKPGGIAAALEFAPDDDRLTPAVSGAFALVMLATTPAGDAYTVRELTGMYGEAGFKQVKTCVLPLGMQQVITGIK